MEEKSIPKYIMELAEDREIDLEKAESILKHSFHLNRKDFLKD